MTVTMKGIEVVCPSADGVGESAHWSEDERALYWVDIVGKAIKRLEPATGRLDRWSTPGFPTAIARRRANPGAIVTVGNSVCLFNFGDRFEVFATPEPNQPDQRLNEAACDPQGRFWVSSMQTNLDREGRARTMTRSSGRLYCVDIGGSVNLAGHDLYGIPNTMAWRSDGTFLLADTLAHAIYSFDYEAGTGALGPRRLYARTVEPGAPDGSALDSDGYLWNASFGGGRLVRYAPDGTVDRVVTLPVSNPTSCAFGGDGFATLFVTSARFTLTAEQIAANPLEGAVLALDIGARGLPPNLFG